MPPTRNPKKNDGFFNLTLALLCTADLEGRLLEVNPGWTEALGFSAAELKKKPILELTHIEDKERVAKELEKLSQRPGSASFEFRARAKDGAFKWLAFNAASVPQERLIRGIARDVTEQKRLENMRDEIIEMTTHELRTPLTAIHAALHLMLSGDFGPLPPDHKRFAEMAYGNCERMARMINDFLDMEKMESGRSELKKVPVEVGPLLEAAVQANGSFAGRFGVTYRLRERGEGLTVLGDGDALIQVLTNLLSNAAKYSPAQGEVDVAAARRDGVVRVSVTDHGPGIPPEFQDRIFQRYAQVGGTDPRKKGSGLGLRIAKGIVERLGGSIGFTTKEGEGSTFFFELPEPGVAGEGVPPPKKAGSGLPAFDGR